MPEPRCYICNTTPAPYTVRKKPMCEKHADQAMDNGYIAVLEVKPTND